METSRTSQAKLYLAESLSDTCCINVGKPRHARTANNGGIRQQAAASQQQPLHTFLCRTSAGLVLLGGDS